MKESEYTTILLEKNGPVSRITLNRPEKLNVINNRMRLELDTAISDISRDESCRVVIVNGAGSSFCAGADIEEFANKDRKGNAATSTISRSMLRSIENAPQPFIAKLRGYVLGGGLEIALACDFRIASDQAELGLTEVNLGMIAGAGGTQRLPRIVGVAKAKELIFLAKRIKAPEAEQIGLIHRALPSDELDSYVDSLAEELAGKASIAIASAKTALNKVWESTDLDSGLMWERSLADLCSETADRVEGLRAFQEHRKPNFAGR